MKVKFKKPRWRRPYKKQRAYEVYPVGRKSIQCEMGQHKDWSTFTMMGIPIMYCTRCGVALPKFQRDKNYTRREISDKFEEGRRYENYLATRSIHEILEDGYEESQMFRRDKHGKRKRIKR